ncbi:5-methyltetrahydropteroyltriglutamate-homocysteine S-methyltransferase [Pseudohyphozyma bogoriensis]|nr:5-methyltetrahydropteroyltriglutamate-homocysteine S-methyltransferase [Pseudohyphozyma bogoriensis]
MALYFFTMSAHVCPPFRSDHIGSLKRPAELLRLRAEFDAGKITRSDLKVAEDKAIADSVAEQRACGLKSFTDGEFRRHMFFDGFFDNLDGMTTIENPSREIFNMYVPDIKAFFESHAEKAAATMVCTGKLERTKQMYRPEFEYLASILPADEVKNAKMTLAAPEWYHLRHGSHAYNHEIYKNDAEYFADIAKAYRAELADLYDAGCRNVQFDDPILAYFCSQDMLAGMKAAGIDSDAMLDSYIKLYNDCIEGKPKDMTVGVHLCRGNFKDGMHFSEGGYEAISSKLFKELNADTYYLEYDTERAGGFEPLADLPAHKSVVLGLVSSKFPKLEQQEDLIKRINSAAEFVAKGANQTVEEALQRLCLSPQCGFASHAEGNPVTDEDVRKKLTLCHETAKAVWPKDA